MQVSDVMLYWSVMLCCADQWCCVVKASDVVFYRIVTIYAQTSGVVLYRLVTQHARPLAQFKITFWIFASKRQCWCFCWVVTWKMTWQIKPELCWAVVFYVVNIKTLLLLACFVLNVSCIVCLININCLVDLYFRYKVFVILFV